MPIAQLQPGALNNLSNTVKATTPKVKIPKVNTPQLPSFSALPKMTQNAVSTPATVGIPGTVTTQFGGSTKFEKFHPGIDIANAVGTPLPATAEGTVTYIDSGKKHGDTGFGNRIVLTDSQGNKHQFSHLDKVLVKVGQPIKRGEIMGTIGDSGSTYSSSGNGTGPHLDYRIVDAYQKYINPTNFLRS